MTVQTGRCPVCRAAFRNQPTCSRCGVDLTPLMLLEALAYGLREQARQALAEGQPAEARRLAELSLQRAPSRAGLALHQLASFLSSID